MFKVYLGNDPVFIATGIEYNAIPGQISVRENGAQLYEIDESTALDRAIPAIKRNNCLIVSFPKLNQPGSFDQMHNVPAIILPKREGAVNDNHSKNCLVCDILIEPLTREDCYTDHKTTDD